MNRFIKLITVSVFVMTVVLTSVNVYSTDSNVEYTGNTGNLIFESGSEHTPSDLFADFKNIMPGASITQKITLKNNADDNVKVRIYLRSLGSDKESEAFLNQLQLTVSKADNNPLFDAKADKTDGLTDWKEIGLLYSGGKADLTLTLDVPISLDNSYQNQLGKITWQFMAMEMPVGEDLWICPKCRESHYHIKDYEEYSEYICEVCGYSACMTCSVCDGKMHKVVYKNDDGKEWFYYVCEHDAEHHTEPIPQTGDNQNLPLWIGLASSSGILLLILIVFSRKRKQRQEAERYER